nr:hypothetical protein [Cellulomonas iranensis]
MRERTEPQEPQHERRHDGAHAVVHVPELEDERTALAARVEVLLDRARVACTEAAAHVRAELAGRAAAAVVERVLQVHLQVRLAQALACPVGQRGRAVGGQAEQRRDLRGRQALDLAVPQHGLPALGQRAERARTTPRSNPARVGSSAASTGSTRSRASRRRRSAACAGPPCGAPRRRDARP